MAIMRPVWVNDGEPDENGDIICYVENEKGVRISRFKGKTIKEVADQLLYAQSNANQIISRLTRPDRATAPQTINLKDSNLTEADRMRLADQMSDPATVVEAVTEIVTSAAGGVAPRAVAAITADTSQKERDAYYRAEAEAFMQDNPDYYPVQQNRDKLFATLKANNYDLTRNNLSIVYQTLADQNEMIPWPEGENEGQPRITQPASGGTPPAMPNGRTEPNPPTPTNTRPRSVSTGIRQQDASALPPAPTPRKKLTRAELEAMPRAEYEARLRDPEFRKQVDAL
jgi:hypothetical protein